MKPINDKEYKRIYVDRILSQLKNNSNKATHMKEIKMIKPKTPINNLGKNSKNDNAFKNQYQKTLQEKINLNMKKDKSSEDVQMGIIPPIADNRTTEQKIADSISIHNTAHQNAQLLFKDPDQAGIFINWLLLQHLDMTLFFNEHFADIKMKFFSSKLLLAQRVIVFLKRLFEKEIRTGGLDDPLQRSDFINATGGQTEQPNSNYDGDGPDSFDNSSSVGSISTYHTPNSITNLEGSREVLERDLEKFLMNKEDSNQQLTPAEQNALVHLEASETNADENLLDLPHNEDLNAPLTGHTLDIIDRFGNNYSDIHKKFPKQHFSFVFFNKSDAMLIQCANDLHIPLPQLQPADYRKHLIKEINKCAKFVHDLYREIYPFYEQQLDNPDADIDKLNIGLMYCSAFEHLFAYKERLGNKQQQAEAEPPAMNQTEQGQQEQKQPEFEPHVDDLQGQLDSLTLGRADPNQQPEQLDLQAQLDSLTHGREAEQQQPPAVALNPDALKLEFLNKCTYIHKHLPQPLTIQYFGKHYDVIMHTADALSIDHPNDYLSSSENQKKSNGRRMIDKMIQKIDSINEWWQYILTENPDTRDIDVDVLSRKVNDVSAFKDMADEINRLKQ